METTKLDEIKKQAEEILQAKYGKDAYYVFNIWEKYGKKRAYFQAFESGHGMGITKPTWTKELRRTAFFVDMIENKIVDQGLYSKLGNILSIRMV